MSRMDIQGTPESKFRPLLPYRPVSWFGRVSGGAILIGRAFRPVGFRRFLIPHPQFERRSVRSHHRCGLLIPFQPSDGTRQAEERLVVPEPKDRAG